MQRLLKLLPPNLQKKCGIISNIGNINNVKYTLLGVRMLIKDKKEWIKYHVTFHLPRLLVPYFEMKFPGTKVCALFYSRMRFDVPIPCTTAIRTDIIL